MAADSCYCAPDMGIVCAWHLLVEPARAATAALKRDELAALARRRPPFQYVGVDRYGRTQHGAVVAMSSGDLITLLRIKKQAGWRRCVISEWRDPDALIAELANAGGREFRPVLHRQVGSR